MNDQALPVGAKAVELDIDAVRKIIRGLPGLPSVVRYLDEYDDEIRSVRTEQDKWDLVADTRHLKMRFDEIEDADVRLLAKHYFAFLFHKLAAVTVQNIYFGFLRWRDWRHKVLRLLILTPSDLHEFWMSDVVGSDVDEAAAVAVKWYVFFLCEMAIGHFRPSHVDLVTALPFDWNGNYLGVINGEAVISTAQEQSIIRHLDSVVRNLAEAAETVTDEVLTKACLLCISYQYGLRPVQICRVDLADLRFYESDDGKPIVHFTAYRAKKRDAAEKTPFTSKVKPDWVPLFAEYRRRRKLGPMWQQCGGSDAKMFTLSKAAIISAIGDVVDEVTGKRSTATNLRHSAAQRMADSGASVEEVAEFLGHSDLDTCLVYFEASPAQAEVVNKAMAMSPIYSKIAEVARTGTIDKSSLLALPDDQQVGGMPHGVPISGIGACRIGQSLCTKNPVLSCYGCRKFIPANDAEVHRQALDDLRGVVRFFFDEARGGTQSKAYTQLSETLEAIKAVIADVEVLDEDMRI